MDAEADGMWKGSNSHFPLSETIDASRTDLLDAFDDAPLARHELELQLFVSSIRGSGRIPRLVLVRCGEGRWQVARIASARGGEPALVSPRVFTRLEDAERFVMGVRLQALADAGLTTGLTADLAAGGAR